jgi:hypothetical protein
VPIAKEADAVQAASSIGLADLQQAATRARPEAARCIHSVTQSAVSLFVAESKGKRK